MDNEPLELSKHSLCLWSSNHPSSFRPPLELLGEACVPVALSPIFLLNLVPFITSSNSPNLILGCFNRSGLILKFGFCGRNHPLSSPAQVGAPYLNYLLGEHL